MALVSLEQVNLALHLDLGEPSASMLEDERTYDVQLKIGQAEDAILDYLKAPADKWTAETVPPRVAAAIVLAVRGLLDGDNALLAGLYDNDRANPIVGLLQRLRDPALA